MTMTEQEIVASIGEIVEEICGIPASQVTPEKKFLEDLEIDSLGMVEIAVAAQDNLGVAIPDEQLRNLETVQAVVDFVRNATVSA
jgi:acyl carrier protein